MNTRQKLDRYVEECLEREFAFGQFDCGLFVGEWADRLTGSSLVREVRGKYNCPSSSFRILGKHPVAYAFEALKGAGFVETESARVGDIVCLHGGGMGIVHMLGEKLAIVGICDPRGIVYVPMQCANRVLTWDWR